MKIASDKDAELTKKYLPSLDGWRAFSIFIVLAAHASETRNFEHIAGTLPSFLPFCFDGNLGVRFFFVISGFLITHLLLQEYKKFEGISFKNFYIRRAIRILPVYTVYLIVLAILQISTNLADFDQKAITWLGDLTFTVNFLPRGAASGHLWSLAVEEQFYILWPFIFVWLIRKKIHYRWVLIIPAIVAILCHIVFNYMHVPWIFHSLFMQHSSLVNFDTLAVGCYAAFFIEEKQHLIASSCHKGRVIKILAALTCASVIALPYYCGYSYFQAFWKIGGNLLQALAFAVLLVFSIIYPKCFWILNKRLVIKLGVLSYSVYIWQQIYYAGSQLKESENTWWLSFPWWLVAALITGWVSYYGFEQPLMKLRRYFRRV